MRALSEVDFLIPPEINNKNPSWYALVFQYDENKAKHPITSFIKRLQDLGLSAIEQPNSTCPLPDLPLFAKSHIAFPRFYQRAASAEKETFTHAENFYQHAIKMPVWARWEDKAIVDKYIHGILRVAYELNAPCELSPKL